MSGLHRRATQTGVALIGVAALVAGLPIAGAAPMAGHPASPFVCRSHGPIGAASLAAGVSTRGCRLVGRLVVSGDVAVRVPPAGVGVGVSGVSGQLGSGPGLQVANIGGTVTASIDGDLVATSSAPRGSAAAPVPAACDDARSALEGGPDGHAWATTLHWRYNNKSTPTRMTAAAASRQFKLANSNVVKADDDCGLKGTPRVSSRFDGYTALHPNIAVTPSGRLSCGTFNRKNTVAFGGLPGNYLGWTCYWWGGSGAMIAADMRIESGRKVVLQYAPSCTKRYDLQSIATHEWGHAFGLGHVGKGQSRLTMSPLLPPCNIGPRTLGLGDWKGMKRLYGLR
ncbi:MAG: matrixin family metalloprotease [Nocardioidaceae bacterium]